MTLWTIYIHAADGKLHEVEIDSEKTFGEFRRKVSDIINIRSNDLVLVGAQEYNYNFNSEKISNIINDEITLYAVYQVGGGKYFFINK